MDLLLKDLQPGQQYALQVRARNDSQSSSWSTVYNFQAEGDSLAPAPVTGLTWTVSGTAFSGSWTAPTTNADATPLKDLKDYKVTLTANAMTAFYFVSELHFTLPIEANIVDFAGAQAVVQISVQARDTSGNLSTAVTVSTSASFPSSPTGFVVTGVPLAAQAAWDVSIYAAFDHFELYMSTASGFTPGPTSLVYSGPSNAYTYTTPSTATLYFKLRQVDVFKQASSYVSGSATPVGVSGSDTSSPSEPTGVITTSATSADGSSQISVSWAAVTSSNLGFYVVRYSTDQVNWQFINVPRDQTATIISNLLPSTSYYVAVAAVSLSNYSSLFGDSATYPQTTATDTTAPSQPSAPTVTSNTQSVQVAHSMTKAAGGNLEVDTDYLEVHGSSVTGFTPSSTTLVGTIQSGGSGITVSAIFYYGVSNSTSNMYWKVIAVDKSKNKSIASAQTIALPGLVQGVNIASATITDANINNLNANKITAGTGFINDLTVNSNLTVGSTGHVKSSNYDGVSNGWSLDTTGLEIFGGTISAAALQLQDSANLCPSPFADFEFASSYYHNASNAVNTTTSSADSGVNLATQFTGALTGRQCMRVYNTTLAFGSTNKYFFAPNGLSSTGVNIAVNPGTYIISLYAKKNGTPSQFVKLSAYTNTGVAVQTAALNITSSTLSGGRINGTVVIPSGVQSIKLYLEIGPNSGSTGYDIIIDSVQIERQIGGLSTPSPWRKPGNTSIDGGAIVTGSITSSAASATIAGQPAWSIDTAGNMLIGSAQIRGSLIVGQGTEAASTVFSGNYVAGTTGWTIKGDGSVEFNSGLFRGSLDISQTINSQTYDFNVSNDSANYRVNIDSNNPQNSVGISGNSPSTTYRGFAQQYVLDSFGNQVFDANTPVQAIVRLTPDGYFQIMHDPTNNSSLFNTDGYNMYQASGTARINQYYSFAESTWGPTRNNQSIYGYPGRSQIVHQTRGIFADANGAATTPKMEIISSVATDAAAERGVFYDSHTTTTIKSSGYHRFISGNKVKANFDAFTNTFTYYQTNMSTSGLIMNSLNTNGWAAGRTNMNTLKFTASVTSGNISLTTSTPVYDYACTPGDELQVAVWLSCSNPLVQVQAHPLFNNGATVSGNLQYINQQNPLASGQKAGFPYHYGHEWVLTVPAGASACAMTFNLQGMTAGDVIYMTAVTMCGPNDDNDKVRFAEIGRTDSLSGESSIVVDWEPYPTFYSYCGPSVTAGFNDSEWVGTSQDFNSKITLKTSWVDSLIHRETDVSINPDNIALDLFNYDQLTANGTYFISASLDKNGWHAWNMYADGTRYYGSATQAILQTQATNSAYVLVQPTLSAIVAGGVAAGSVSAGSTGVTIYQSGASGVSPSALFSSNTSTINAGGATKSPYIQLNLDPTSGNNSMYFNLDNTLTHPYLLMSMNNANPAGFPVISIGGQSWVSPTLNSPFGHVTSNIVQYRMMPDGTVQLRGSTSWVNSTTTNGQTIFTLPTGYRPLNGDPAFGNANEWVVSQPGSNTYQKIIITTAGAVNIGIGSASTGTTQKIDFSSIRFLVV